MDTDMRCGRTTMTDTERYNNGCYATSNGEKQSSAEMGSPIFRPI